MNDNDNTSVAMPMIKIVSSWLAAFGLKSWGEFASFLAALYTLLLIVEWVHNRFFKGKAK